MLALALLAGVARAPAQAPYTFITLAGPPGGTADSVDGPGNLACFNRPAGVVSDAQGRLYVADTANASIRRISPNGLVTTLAGVAGIPGSADGSRADARFDEPRGVALDALGNLCVADSGNHTIRRVTPDGQVTTVAGQAGQPGSADGLGAAARFNRPSGLAVDAQGNLFVADAANHTIRRITPGGNVTTLAGLAGQAGTENGVGAAARFNNPRGVATDPAGNIYVADTRNHTIRQITPAGAVTTLAGRAGTPGLEDDNGSSALFNSPRGLTVVSTNGVLFICVADSSNSLIRAVSPDGTVWTLAGLAGCAGNRDGAPLIARFDLPSSLTADSAGNVYVADTENNTLRKVTASEVTTAAGLADGAASTGIANATPTTATFRSPAGIAADVSGAVYVADTGNSAIRRISSSGLVTTVAGLAGSPGYADGPGPTARFAYPIGVAVDFGGTVYVSDTANQTIRKISPDGLVSTLAGQAWSAGTNDGLGRLARFSAPAGLALDPLGGLLYVADSVNCTIRQIRLSDGLVTTLAGVAGQAGTNDGPGASARFNQPVGVAVDRAGDICVADTRNHAVRKITLNPTVAVTTVAGLPGTPGEANGTNSTARFHQPGGVAVDLAGTLYVSDSSNSAIRRITFTSDAGQTNAVVTTLSGQIGEPGFANGTNAEVRFRWPVGLTVDRSSTVLVADTGNQMLRRITQVSTLVIATTLAGQAGVVGSADATPYTARFRVPGGVDVDLAGNILVADTGNSSIRKITPEGQVTSWVGLSGTRGFEDGQCILALFNYPFSVTVDRTINGFAYVSDTVNQSIRQVNRLREVTTLVGEPSPSAGPEGDLFAYPCGIAVTPDGALIFLADWGNHAIRRVTPSGTVTTLAGRLDEPGSADGVGGEARFNHPRGVAVNAAQTVFVADTENHTIRRITPDGTVTTVAGLAGQPGTNDGPAGVARFNSPNGVAVDNAGILFVADSGNSTIRRISLDGTVTTLAGLPGVPGDRDGTGSNARFNLPGGLTVDAGGFVLVADSGNNAIRRGAPTAPDRPVIDLANAPVGAVRQLDIAHRTTTDWRWSVIRRPSKSTAQLSSATSPNPTFTPDIADLYVFQLLAVSPAGQMAIGTVELQATAVPSPLAAQASLTIRRIEPARNTVLTLHSQPGQVWRLQVSDDLSTWTSLTTLTNASGADLFIDTAADLPLRFYRLQQ